MLLRSEAYVKLACSATECSGAQLQEHSSGGDWAWRSAKVKASSERVKLLVA